MKEYSDIKFINEHRKQARQFHPNAIVVPIEKARAAIERAYMKGVNVGIDTAMAGLIKSKSHEER